MKALLFLLAAAMLNPAVTQGNIHKTICRPGYTATIRPPASYTTALKRSQLPPGADVKLYEEDHRVALGLGGSPRSPVNLRPQLWVEAHVKDIEEVALMRAVCSGKVKLRAAQEKLIGDWP